MIIKALGLLTCLTLTSFSISNMGNDIDVERAKSELIIPQDANTQVYELEDGSKNTIIWSRGVDAPKMTSDPALLGKDGYFNKRVINGKNNTYINYEAPLKQGAGYFDLNKDFQNPPISEETMCYLSSAANSIYYWLEQNADLINIYIQNLKDGVYGQPEGLTRLVPYNDLVWSNMMKGPTMATINGYYSQALGQSYVSRMALNAYFMRGDGYFMDRVIDFFINGYNRWEHKVGYDPQNEEEFFLKDREGGFFNPIFGKTRLTHRYETSRYDIQKEVIYDGLVNDKALGLAYFSQGASGAHAITIWGGEFDQAGELVRLYVTDSDDVEDPAKGTNIIRGLHSMDVHYTSDGSMFISSRSDAMENPGGFIQAITTLDLARDLFMEKLNDTAKPIAPVINSQPLNTDYPLNALNIDPLKIDASSPDGGYVYYQWYKSDDPSHEGKAIPNAHYATYTPDVNKLETAYYYCEVSNEKNGWSNKLKSDVVKVNVTNQEVIDAAVPTFKWNHNTVNYQQYLPADPIKTNASVSDGGTLSYKWYAASSNTASGGSLIKDATGATFTPSTNNVGRNFYYCEITNYNPKATGKRSQTVTVPFAKCVKVNEPSGDYLDAINYAKLFLDSHVCGFNDNTPADSSIFLNLKQEYLNLSDYAKQYFKNYKGDQNAYSPLLQALAKYDRIISLHGQNEIDFPDFMERMGSDVFTNYAPLNKDYINFNSNVVIISSLVVISFMSVAIFVLASKKTRKQK